MKINVNFLSLPNIVKLVGSKSVVLDFSGQTINDLISEIAEKYGPKVGSFLCDESGELDAILKVVLNDKKWINRDQMDAILKHGDKVTILMLVGGG